MKYKFKVPKRRRKIIPPPPPEVLGVISSLSLPSPVTPPPSRNSLSGEATRDWDCRLRRNVCEGLNVPMVGYAPDDDRVQ